MEKDIFIEGITSLYKKDRLIAFYKNQKFADCIFKINGAEVKAHKLILACSSPVFEKMFFGDMASNEVVISDINLEEFNQVLEFIYTENIKISSIFNAWSLFYIASKYLLDDLIHVCLEYIQKNLTMKSLVLSYEYAEMYNLEDIKSKCFLDIINYINGVFGGDYHMKPTTLYAILDKNVINLDKCDLILQILNWAATECDFREMVAVPENIVNILKEEDIFKYIRKDWLMGKCVDCYNHLVMCRCVDDLTHKTLLLLDEILTWSDVPCDGQKTYKPAPYICERPKLHRPTPYICRHRKEFKIAGRVDLETSEEYISNVSVNRRMILFGILITTEMNPTGKFGTGYEGSITVRVCQHDSDVSVAKPTTFTGIMQYDSDLYISLKDLATIEPELLYEIRISYKDYGNTGLIPVHCYYMSSKLINDSKDSVVSFYEMSGTLVRGLSFYAA